MFAALGDLVTRRGSWFLAAWVLLIVILRYEAPSWDSVSRDDDVRFFPPNYPSVRGQALLERGFPGDVASSRVVIVAERPDGMLTDADWTFVDRIRETFEALQAEKPELGIKDVVDRSDPDYGSRLVAGKPGGGQVSLTAVLLTSTFMSKAARVTVDDVLARLDTLREEAPEGLTLSITGPAAVGHDSNAAANQSIDATTLATVLLVVGILLVVYRSPLLALVPLATIALSAWGSLMAIALMAKPPLNFQVINVTRVFVVVVLFGAGTDYCLFLIARYREELARGLSTREAIAEAIRQVGGALIASAGTVIVGLGMLWFSTFAKIRYTGPAIAVSLAIALLAALTLAPVLLKALGGAIFWPFRAPEHHQGADPERESLEETPMYGFWAAVAGVVVRKPGLILLLSLAVLLPFAWIGYGTEPSYDLLGDLGPSEPSIIGTNAFRRYYSEGEGGPTTLLIHHPDLDFRTQAGLDAVRALADRIAALPRVVEVRALTRPLGQPIPLLPAVSEGREEPDAPDLAGRFRQFGAGIKEQIERAAQVRAFKFYVAGMAPSVPGQLLERVADGAEAPGLTAKPVGLPKVAESDVGHITRIDVVFDASPFSSEAIATLGRVEEVLNLASEPGGAIAGADVGVAGTTVQIADLKRVTTEDQRRMYVLVTLGVYLILVVLLRRPGLCLYLIATVILGYLASLGITDLVFRAFHQGPGPWLGLDWKVGFFLFVILVAVGEDYNIFLMSRVIEEERKHGAIEGTRRAVAHTGGIISSCGVIMAGTFGSMLFGSLTTLRELGFALGLGVLLDTFIVRPILVPAFVVLWHRTWPKARLDDSSPPLPDPEAAAAGRPVLGG